MSILKNVSLTALAATIVLGGAAASFAQEKDSKRGERGQRMNFEQLDVNTDGKLDFAEFSAPMMARFDKADADSNGVVTEEEIASAREGNERGDKRRGGGLMKRIDVDQNGEITKAELEVGGQKMFDRIDADSDGFVSEDDLKKMRGERRGGDRKKENRG